MLCYYLLAGIVANIALVTNIIILLGVMCSIGTTLTLPGIAGVVLTVGMAVDANVLIYERIREELAKGKSLRGAIAAGYARAFGTIFDSHVTTLISSIILIFMGTGEIKGFGVTLTIGVAASLFTALVVTRLIFNFLLDHNWIKSLRMFHLIRATKLDFMRLAKPAFILTWTIILIGMGYGIFDRGSKLFGVDFAGGDSTTFSFHAKAGRGANPRRADRSRRKGFANPISKRRGGGGTETLRVTTSTGSAEKVEQALAESIPAGAIQSHRPAARRRGGGRRNQTLGHHRLVVVVVRHSDLCGVPLRILLRRRRGRRGHSRRVHDDWLLLHQGVLVNADAKFLGHLLGHRLNGHPQVGAADLAALDELPADPSGQAGGNGKTHAFISRRLCEEMAVLTPITFTVTG